MMYSAYKVNKPGDNIQPWCAPFPIWNQSVVPCSVLTVVSRPLTIWLRDPSLGYYPREIKTTSTQRLVRVVPSSYLRLWYFSQQSWFQLASFSPVFLMMYSAYKLNEHGDNIQPWHTLFLIWNQSAVPCRVLTIASWPVYRFLKRQVKQSGIPIYLRMFHSLLWATQSKALV